MGLGGAFKSVLRWLALVLNGGLKEERVGRRGTFEACAGIGTGNGAGFFWWRKGMRKPKLERPLLRLSHSDEGPIFLISGRRAGERTRRRWFRWCMVERTRLSIIYKFCNVIILSGVRVADNLDDAFGKGVSLCDDIGTRKGVVSEKRVGGWSWDRDGIISAEGPAGT